MATDSAIAPHVIGIGGVFIRAGGDKEEIVAWYRDMLGIDAGEYGKSFMWRQVDDAGNAGPSGRTVWSVFERQTPYFEGPYMINYIVRDLGALLDELEAKGIAQLKPREDYEYGYFAWIKDPDGRWIELWQPIEPDSGGE